jgi:hypothetical protein
MPAPPPPPEICSRRFAMWALCHHAPAAAAIDEFRPLHTSAGGIHFLSLSDVAPAVAFAPSLLTLCKTALQALIGL